jgi:hypothetical protein
MTIINTLIQISVFLKRRIVLRCGIAYLCSLCLLTNCSQQLRVNENNDILPKKSYTNNDVLAQKRGFLHSPIGDNIYSVIYDFILFYLKGSRVPIEKTNNLNY